MTVENTNTSDDLTQDKLKKDKVQNKLEEQYLKSIQKIEEGQMLSGTIIQINSEYVFVDVGYKSEGKIPVTEFEEEPKTGDTVEVVVIRKEGREGTIVVSKRKADEKAFWRNVKTAFNDRTPVEGIIAKAIKGGFEVDLGKGIRGFLPLSKTDVSRIEDEDIIKYVKKKSYFNVERLYSNGKVKIILSRKSWLETENKRKREEFFAKTHIGDEVEGTVKSFASFGVFIDLDGFDGLLHINDMSWGHISSPKEMVKVGDKLKLKIIRLDPEENRINLSLKHFKDDPWSSFEDRYHDKKIVKGTVTKLTNFGAFIKLEEGIEGLVHISELSWVKKIKHPKEVLKVDDTVDVMVLNYDITKGKVSLGLKQVLPNPWDDIGKRFPVNTKIKLKVKNFSNFGAFFELEEGIDGLLHLDDFSWTEKYKHPSDALKENEEVELMIIDVNSESRKIKLGLKQLKEDPWGSLKKAYPKGSFIDGEITEITDFGFSIKVQGDIIAKISNNNLFDPNTEKIEDILSKYKVGDTIKSVIVEINPGKQRLFLSRREYFKQQQREEMSKYIHDDKESDTMTLGDMLKDKSS